MFYVENSLEVTFGLMDPKFIVLSAFVRNAR